LSQSQFRAFAENVSAATQYKAIAPAEPLGVVGLDVGVSVSYTPIDDSEDLFDLASSGDFESSGLILPRVSVQKGLPFGEEVIEETRLFAGVNLNLGMNFVLEADKTGDHTSFSIKAGFRF
jgi:hypothetical protein